MSGATKGKQPANNSSQDLSSDSDNNNLLATSAPTPAPSEEPWKREFNRYIKGEDELSEGMTLVQWWGVCLFSYNVGNMN